MFTKLKNQIQEAENRVTGAIDAEKEARKVYLGSCGPAAIYAENNFIHRRGTPELLADAIRAHQAMCSDLKNGVHALKEIYFQTTILMGDLIELQHILREKIEGALSLEVNNRQDTSIIELYESFTGMPNVAAPKAFNDLDAKVRFLDEMLIEIKNKKGGK